MNTSAQERWRLVLGKAADADNEVPMSGDLAAIDTALSDLYDSGERKGGMGSSSPKINRWLGDIRKYFPTAVVRVLQKDAMERLGIAQMLFEPELLASLEPDVHLVGTLLSLHQLLPQQTRATAQIVVRKVVEQVEKRLKLPLLQAISGSLSRSVRNRRPKLHEIDWHGTIRANLRHYQPAYKTIIPDTLRGFGKKGQSLRDVILLIDQSGSMSSSVVYASILGAVMASIKSIKTHLVVFDTNVVDLTPALHDPVSVLFGTQLGGGTDINKALAYAETLVQNSRKTILVLLTDLFEGGSPAPLLRRITALKAAGVQVICLLALNDEGAPSYDHDLAADLIALDIPTFACTPSQFPDLMAAAIKGEDVRKVIAR